MSKWLKLSLLTVLCLNLANLASAQGQLYSNIAWRYTPAGAFPASGASVTICTSSATGTPCTPTISVFQDSALSVPVANPLPVCSTSPQTGCIDGLGNFSFYMTPGAFTYTITGAGLTAYGPIPANTSCSAGVTCVTSSGNNAFTGNNSHSGTETFANINKRIFVDQQIGATADVKFANACAALPATGGTLDATGFGAGNQTIAATVSCGSATQPITFLWDGATVFQPSTASVNMFSLNPFNTWSGILHIDTTNQATYSGNPISNPSGVTLIHAHVDGIRVDMASGSTGPCMSFNSPNGSTGIFFNEFGSIRCTAGTATFGLSFQDSAGGFINANKFSSIRVYNAKYGVYMNQAGAGDIGGNKFFDYDYEANSLATALNGVYMTGAGTPGAVNGNQFYMDCYDQTGGNTCVNTASVTFVKNNIFVGDITAVTDSSTFISNTYFFQGNAGTVNGNNVFKYVADFVDGDQLVAKTFILGCSALNCATPLTGVTGTGTSLVTNTSPTISGTVRSGLIVSDQGSVCTNGELALSAGWQSTGLATVTAVAGNGQTCSWTITTGTTTAANPTVTDTLTNPLPNATTVCELNIHGGTHTPAAGEGFQQTTISATVPAFTFNGTPTAGGTTYFVTRRCGP